MLTLAQSSFSSLTRKSSISPCGTAGWLWNFRLGNVGRWHDSEPLSLGGPPGHNELGVQLEESTSIQLEESTLNPKLTRKLPGNMRQLVHPMLSPGGPGYDRGRLTPVPGPGAGNHDSPNALLLPHLPRAP
jgi:hypothetical protein